MLVFVFLSTWLYRKKLSTRYQIIEIFDESNQKISLAKNMFLIYLGTSREKKARGFLIFPRDAKMGFGEIHPRGLFYDFEESSPRNYFLEILVPRGLFLFLEDPKPRDINTRFSSRYYPRGIHSSR